MDLLHEKKESLWLLAASPAIWAAHFMLCYLTAAIWCAKLAGPDGSIGVVRWAIALYTVFAVAGLGVIGWVGYRKARWGGLGVPHDADAPESRRRFLGVATLLLSALALVAILYAALVAAFIWSCD
jgi:hypothetical protein